MIFEMFWKWLTHDKRKYCDHDWNLDGDDYVPNMYLYRRIEIYKCSKCGEKERRATDDLNYIML